MSALEEALSLHRNKLMFLHSESHKDSKNENVIMTPKLELYKFSNIFKFLWFYFDF